MRSRGSFPQPVPPGDWNYYIQRGATLQTYRPLGVSTINPFVAVAQPVDTLVAYPFPIGLGCVLDELAFNVTALAAGSSARVGVYRATSSRNIYPSSLVVDAGSVATTSNGFKNAAAVAKLRPGLYWAVYNCTVLAPTVSALASLGTPILGWVGGVAMFSLRVASAFGALPATFPGGAALNANHSSGVWGRFSS